MEAISSQSKAEKKRKITTLKVNLDTKSRIDHLRVYKRESYDDIIQKMLNLLNIARINPQETRARLILMEKERKRNLRE